MDCLNAFIGGSGGNDMYVNMFTAAYSADRNSLQGHQVRRSLHFFNGCRPFQVNLAKPRDVEEG
jgi:hypothetical protein